MAELTWWSVSVPAGIAAASALGGIFLGGRLTEATQMRRWRLEDRRAVYAASIAYLRKAQRQLVALKNVLDSGDYVGAERALDELHILQKDTMEALVGLMLIGSDEVTIEARTLEGFILNAENEVRRHVLNPTEEHLSNLQDLQKRVSPSFHPDVMASEALKFALLDVEASIARLTAQARRSLQVD